MSEPRITGWVQHDRTHLELLAHLPLPYAGGRREYTWEVYFLLPSSLRINATTFSDAALQRTLQSHVRLAPPSLTVQELAEWAAESLRRVATQGEVCVREIKLFGCMAKVSLLAERRRVLALLRRNARTGRLSEPPDGPLSISERVDASVDALRNLATTYREVVSSVEGKNAQFAAHLVDAYLSRLLEDVLAKLALKLRKRGFVPEAHRATLAALTEAQYAVDHGLTPLQPGTAERDVEALESSSHYLKRFTSSILWLRQESFAVGQWQLQLLYSVAASIAMAFAVGLTFYTGGPSAANLGDLALWALVVVLGYAGKDRIKASLQGTFSRWIQARLPDRQSRLLAPGERVLGVVEERNAFVPRTALPEQAAVPSSASLLGELRSATNLGHLLWFQKSFSLLVDPDNRIEGEFQELVEIVRLDVGRWLAHADNSPRKIYFADLTGEEARAASAPRTYTIEIVHRLTSDGSSAPGDWQTTHVVVDREGVRRVESAVPTGLGPIKPEGTAAPPGDDTGHQSVSSARRAVRPE